MSTGPERGTVCLPPSSGPLGLTGGLLEREFPVLTPCAPLQATKKLEFGAMWTGPLKGLKNESSKSEKDMKMKENLPSNRSFSGSIYDMKLHF